MTSPYKSSRFFRKFTLVLLLFQINNLNGNLHNAVEEFEFPSSSTNWTLSTFRRNLLRKDGYCVSLCGFGHNYEADSYDSYMHHFFLTKASGEFRELSDFIGFDGLDGTFSSMLEEIDAEDELQMQGARTRKTLSKLIDKYCEVTDIAWEDCHRLNEDVVTLENGESCVRQCHDMIHQLDVIPTFEQLPPERQEFEKCLDSYRGPLEFYDYNDKNKTTTPAVLQTFQKYGFVVIKNFFPTELMEKVNLVLNTWDQHGKWLNYTYSDFYSSFEYQLSQYEYRKEIVLPIWDEPFKTILDTVHESFIMNVLRDYGGFRPINLDFPASIMSYPGAVQQETHGDHGFEASMIKVGAALHDIPEISGPTSFCPCTQRHGITHPLYNKDCGIRHHPDFVSAGTVIIYDMSVKHRGSANRGNIRRYLLDLSYSAGPYFNTYQQTYPERAQEFVLKSRATYKNL